LIAAAAAERRRGAAGLVAPEQAPARVAWASFWPAAAAAAASSVAEPRLKLKLPRHSQHCVAFPCRRRRALQASTAERAAAQRYNERDRAALSERVAASAAAAAAAAINEARLVQPVKRYALSAIIGALRSRAFTQRQTRSTIVLNSLNRRICAQSARRGLHYGRS
jgi:hypothetical protein